VPVGCQQRAGVVFPHICPSPGAHAHVSMPSRRTRGQNTTSAALYTNGRVAGRTPSPSHRVRELAEPRTFFPCCPLVHVSVARSCGCGDAPGPHQPPHAVAKRLLRDGLVRCVYRRGVYRRTTHGTVHAHRCVHVRLPPRSTRFERPCLTERTFEANVTLRVCSVTAIHEKVVLGNTVGVAQGRTLHQVG
jgi:hypothetical protein